jgi:hypothetical protein
MNQRELPAGWWKCSEGGGRAAFAAIALAREKLGPDLTITSTSMVAV